MYSSRQFDRSGGVGVDVKVSDICLPGERFFRSGGVGVVGGDSIDMKVSGTCPPGERCLNRVIFTGIWCGGGWS